MKHFFVFYIISFFIYQPILSQENSSDGMNGLYVQWKAGFTFPVSQSTIGSPRSEVGDKLIAASFENGALKYSEKNPFGSRGAGGTIGGSVGYMFSENFGAELEFTFIRTLQITDAEQSIDTSALSRTYYAQQVSHTNMFRAAPMVVVTGNSGKKIRPYAKFGLLIPLAGATVATLNLVDETGELADNLFPVLDEELYNDVDSVGRSLLGDNFAIPTTSVIEAKTYGQFSLGFTSKIGAEMQLSDKWSFFGEMEMNMLTVKAKQTKITSFNSTVSNEALVGLAEQRLGREIQSLFTLEDIPEILRLTNYENEITESSNSTYDVSSSTYNRSNPYEQLTFRDNYNSFGFMIGVKYRF